MSCCALALVVLVGCNERPPEAVSPATSTPVVTATVDATESATPAATRSASPNASAEISEDFRLFAADVAHALATGDVSFFSERLSTRTAVCTEIWALNGLCERAGETYQGVAFARWASDFGGVASPAFVQERVSLLWHKAVPGAADAFGDASPTVYALGEVNLPDAPLATILTAIVDLGSGPQRATLVLSWVEDDGQWSLVHLLDAVAIGEQPLDPGTALSSPLLSWERFRPQ